MRCQAVLRESITVVAQNVDLLWFLHSNNTLYDCNLPAGRREGVRSILTMLLKGPGNVATEAILGD